MGFTTGDFRGPSGDGLRFKSHQVGKLYISCICVFFCLLSLDYFSTHIKLVIALQCHYSHEHSGSYGSFTGSIGQGKPRELSLCCLDGKNSRLQ